MADVVKFHFMCLGKQIIKLLHEAGIDKIEDVSVHRGFAFLDLETNKDAQNAWKKLQKKDAFGKGQNIKVAWAEPLNDPDEEEMKKVPPLLSCCVHARVFSGGFGGWVNTSACVVC